MADTPQSQAQPARPLSPHLSVYRWAPTMIVSITHRVTGVALCAGMLVVAWWLVSISNGPEVYQNFYTVMTSVPGLVVLFGFTWSLVFHLLQGVRHLAWDLGYGFAKQTARRTALLVAGLSLVAAIALFAFVWTGHAGYVS